MKFDQIKNMWENNANTNTNRVPTASRSKPSPPNVRVEEKVSVKPNNGEELKPSLSKEKKPAEK